MPARSRWASKPADPNISVNCERSCCSKSEYEVAWDKHAASILKSELKRHQVSYGELASRLTANGIPTNEESVANKLSRGSFSATFLLQCLHALGMTTLDVKISPQLQATIDRTPCQ